MKETNQIIVKRSFIILVMILVLFLLNFITYTTLSLNPNKSGQIVLLYLTDLFFIAIIIQELFILLKPLFSRQQDEITNIFKQKEIKTNQQKLDGNILTDTSYYFDDLITQYIHRKNLFLFQLFSFIGLLFGGFSSFYFGESVFSLNFYIIFLEISISFIAVMFVCFLPIMFFNKKSFIKKYQTLLECVNSGNITGLTLEVQNYEKKQAMKTYPDKDNTLVEYFNSFILMNEENYDQAINKLQNLAKTTFNSIAFKYEYKNLIGECYRKVGEIENAKRYYNESLTGFKKVKIQKAIFVLEQKLASVK